MTMESQPDLPITGVCVVSDPAQCPPNYTLVDKCFDKSEDADLWKDGFFTRRVMRYLCVERQIPTQTQDVLVDVALVNERDPIPSGFSALEYTQDTREKSTKKKFLCVRWMIPSLTTDAISELIFLTRAQRRAPAGYTLVGELNNMSLCYKMGKVPSGVQNGGAASSVAVPAYSAAPVQGYGGGASGSLPYAPPVPPRPPAAGNTMTSPRGGTLERTLSHLVHPLSGIEWRLNPQYAALINLQDITIPHVKGKTLMELEREYAYEFTVEQSVSRNARLS